MSISIQRFHMPYLLEWNEAMKPMVSRRWYLWLQWNSNRLMVMNLLVEVMGAHLKNRYYVFFFRCRRDMMQKCIQWIAIPPIIVVQFENWKMSTVILEGPIFHQTMIIEWPLDLAVFASKFFEPLGPAAALPWGKVWRWTSVWLT